MSKKEVFNNSVFKSAGFCFINPSSFQASRAGAVSSWRHELGANGSRRLCQRQWIEAKFGIDWNHLVQGLVSPQGSKVGTPAAPSGDRTSLKLLLWEWTTGIIRGLWPGLCCDIAVTVHVLLRTGRALPSGWVPSCSLPP